jgi:UDP-N-acetylglucosamine 2-epimerase (non-hydrolysing)
MHFLHVVGARPNFMKAKPVHAALAAFSRIKQTLVHSGQHYDMNMSDVFFQQLELPEPDVNLQVGSGSHAQQTAQVISRFEEVVLERKPDVVLVYGDVNSTVAAALVCAKLQVPVAHIEAGLRSFDRTMPEEINRVLTDQISSFLFTPSSDGNENLEREGVSADKIHLVGNVMIDTLVRMLPQTADQSRSGLPPRFALVTLHRPSNVDDISWLGAMLKELSEISNELPVLFPVHPRTCERLRQAGINGDRSALRLMDPLPYVDFLALQTGATVVITDSGGIQEETTYLGIPCLTVRENTERPVTATMGTNTLVGRSIPRVRDEVQKILQGKAKKGTVPPLWDGHAAERIAAALTGA